MEKKATIYEKMYNIKKQGVTLQRNTKAFNYKYATLDQIQEKLNPLLEENRLVIVHEIKEWFLVTQVIDIDNNKIMSSSIKISTTKPQDVGSEITYYRRYNLVCLFDLEVEDDDWKKAQQSKIDFKPNTEQRNKAIAKKASLDLIKKHYTISKENETLYISQLEWAK